MKRILIALLVSVTIIAQLKAQTPRTPENPAAVAVWPQVSTFQNHWRMNEAGEKGKQYASGMGSHVKGKVHKSPAP